MNAPIDLNRDWLFRQERAGWLWVRGYGRSRCRSVDLPHCWNALDTFQDSVAYYRGPGAYRKKFLLPSDISGKDTEYTWILESEGFYGTGDVWLNGRRVAKIDGEYLGFCLDVGKFVVPGENLLAIRLTNRCRSFVLPGIRMPDFLLHGGLAGRIFLRREPVVHLDRNSLQITVDGVNGPRPVVRISALICNSSAVAGSAVTRWTITDPDGRLVECRETPLCEIAARNTQGVARLQFDLHSPSLWSPDQPSLYVVKCEVFSNGVVVDEFQQRFGVRSAVFEPGKGFFLNGKRTELRGCNRHESMPGFGNALPPALHREDARLLKETGCNIVRLSHYPQHPAFLDACDEMGLMVYAEIATWKSVRTGRWLKRALRQMERMILRDRNRPGIILWGMGNESRSRKAYLALGNLARSLDPSRPVTYAENHFHRAIREKTDDLSDVWSSNYELEILEKGCASSRLKTTLVSECSNMPTAARGNWTEELKQVAVIERDLAALDTKEYNSGCIIWCMNDYATLRKKRYLRYSGVVDAWRLPKMSCAFLQARWLDRPCVKVFGDWGVRVDVDGRSEKREIHVFSNCRTITVLRNGRELLSSAGGPHLIFSVDFEPGRLEVRGNLKEHTVADSLQSFGSAVKIHVEATMMVHAAAVRPVAVVEISILDSLNALCTDWNGDVSVRVAGAADSCVFTPDGVLPVSGGLSRTFIVGHSSGAEAVVEVFCASLASGRSALTFT
ncbi:MAG: glycoside hydrolase family 2 TIM barrel-domain containing protein [bacterium]